MQLSAMITINLLPHRISSARRESVGVHWQLILGIVLVLLSGTVCWSWGNSLLERRDLIRQEKNAQEQELATMIANTGSGEMLLNAPDQSRRLMAQAQFLARTGEQQIFPIRILYEISRSAEPFGIWLSALSIEEDDVVIEGNALSHRDVGQFLQTLEESIMIGRLVRMETQPQTLHEDTIMQKFSLQFTTQRPGSSS